MAGSTVTRRVMVELHATDGNVEETLDKITAKADELEAKHPELKIQIDKAKALAQMSAIRQGLKDEAAKPIEQKIEPKVEDDPAKLKIDELQKKIQLLKLEAKGIKVKVDATDAEIKIATLDAELKGLQDAGNVAGQNAGQQAGGGLLSGFTGTSGMWTAGITAALAALPGIAGIAGTGMGVAMIGGMAAVVAKSVYSNVAPAVNAYQQALNTVGQAHNNAMKQFASYYDALSGSQQHLVDTISAVENAWQNFIQSNTAGMTKILQQGMGLLPKLLSGMSGVLQQVLPQVSGIIKTLGGTLNGLLGIMRASAPAFGPLISSLLQMVNNVLPGLQAIIKATTPMLGTFSQIFTGLGTSVGQTLRSLVPGVQASAQFLAALMQAIDALLPVIGTLASDLAKFLAPIMAQLGGKLMPQLAQALDNILTALSPLLPPIGQLVATILQFTATPMIAGLDAIGTTLLQLQGPIQTVANWLSTLANWAATAFSWLARVISFSTGGRIQIGAALGIGGGSQGGGDISAGLSGPELGGTSVPSFGGISVPSLDGIASGISTATASAVKKGAAKAKVIPALAQGLIQALQGSQAQIWHATESILKTIWGDEKAGLLTQREASALATWVKQDNGRLQALAVQRNAIAKEIAAAKAYAAGVTSSTESTFGLVNSAAGGPNGFLPEGNIIANLQEEVRRVRSFAADIKKLKRMGLNNAYISQLLQAGPVSGGPIADELANGPLSEIAQINAAEQGLAAASTGLGQLGANILYDRGKGAGKGFLSGLEQQERQTEAAMRKLAEALVSGTKHELRVEWVGGAGADQEFFTWLKKHIRIRGGNPQILGA